MPRGGIRRADRGSLRPSVRVRERSWDFHRTLVAADRTNRDAEPARVSRAAPAARRRRVWGFRLGAIFLGALPFVVLELGLRWFGVGNPTAHRDPLAGFSQRHPLFERAGEKYRTVRSRLPFFGDQEFAVNKPTNGFRIFCFGGSTVHGHPYLNATAFPAWLALELNARDPSRRFEAINCGGVSYASYRLAPIVHEVLAYQPDLIVLAMGHNEFLEDRTFQPLKTRSAPRRWIEDQFFSLHLVTCAQKFLGRDQAPVDLALSPEVNPRLDDAPTGYASYRRDEAWHRAVVSQFDQSLRTMIAACRAANVPVMVVTLGANLRDCPPFKSEHRGGLSAEDEARWQSLFDAAGRAEESDLNAALALYQQAGAIDSEFALLAYRRARCFDRLGQTERAREHYLRAKELDVCPLRMVEAVYELQQTIAAETQTPLVDARRLIELLSREQLPGNDRYVDHVHPTIGAHQKIARAIADKLDELRWVSTAVWPDAARTMAYQKQFQGLEPAYFTNGRRRVEWLENWARRRRLYEETLPKDARGLWRYGVRELELGNEPAAWRSFRTALAQAPALARTLAEHAAELRSEGHAEAADRFVQRLAELAREIRSRSEEGNKPYRAGD